MDLNFGTEYKDFTNEVKDFCKKYSGIHFSDLSKEIYDNSKLKKTQLE